MKNFAKKEICRKIGKLSSKHIIFNSFIAKNQVRKPEKFEIDPDFNFDFPEIICISPPYKLGRGLTAPFIILQNNFAE